MKTNPIAVFYKKIRNINTIHLIHSHRRYTKALGKRFPPDQEPKNVNAAIEQLEGIHALRVECFDFIAAKAFFGEEEKYSRQILDLMLPMDEKIPMPERVHQAQMLLMQSNHQ